MPAPSIRRQINIELNPKVYDTLAARAKLMGYTPSAYARLLFDAAFAERVGWEKKNPASNTDLDETVRAVFCLAGQFEPATISRVTGAPETLIKKILSGWKAQSKSSARAI